MKGPLVDNKSQASRAATEASRRNSARAPLAFPPCSAHLRCVTPAVTRQRPAGVCDGLDGELRRTSKLPLSRDVAYDAISSTLPKGAARWPMQRDEPLLRSIRGGAFPFKRWPSFLSAGISWRREAKARLRSLHDAWADTTTPHGRLILRGLAEFERHLIVARTSEGRKRAAARGVLFGRQRKLTAHQHRTARRATRRSWKSHTATR